jgi:hypothetical protein
VSETGLGRNIDQKGQYETVVVEHRRRGADLASVGSDQASARVAVGGFGGARVGRIGFRGGAIGIGRPGIGIGRPGVGWGGWGWRDRGWGWGWGWPVAAGVALGVAAAGSSCWAWNGFTWVNVCHAPYPYYGYW